MQKEISDYDKYGYDYEKYWQDKEVKRDYEDQSERIAIKRLLPKSGEWFCDLGAGFGRLFDAYQDRFDNIILADYSLENLKKAQIRIKNYEPARPAGGLRIKNNPKNPKSPKNPNIYFIALNAYNLPFKDNILDCLLCVRMLHHIENVDNLFKETSRVIVPKGKFILEYANKRHFFEIIKALFGKSKMRPFSLEPTARGEGPFYNFHPNYIESRIKNLTYRQAGYELRIIKTLSVSNLRHKIFKKLIPLPLLLLKEKFLQIILAPIKFGPSIFILSEKKPNKQPLQAKSLPAELEGYKLQAILSCPKCKNDALEFSTEQVECEKCASKYPIIDNIYDFRV